MDTPNTELTRLLRTGVQALVAALVVALSSNFGIEIDETALMVVVFPVVMTVTTALVKLLSEAIPGIGPIIAYLNGPPREVSYRAQDQL